MKYITVKCFSNNVTLPSNQFSHMGYLNEDETEELRRQLISTPCFIVEFDSMKQCEEMLAEMDDEFLNQQIPLNN